MSTWIAMARTNYFRVKDLDQFKIWIESFGTLATLESADEPGMWMIQDTDGDGWPQTRDSDDEDVEEETVDFSGELSAHLPGGEVAILLCIGCDNFKYLTGAAIAVDASGKKIRMSLNDIYRKAERKWPNAKITLAEY